MDAIWPIVILWVVLTVLGARKKKARTQAPVPPRPAAGGGPAPSGQGGFLEEMRRSLEEMQRAAAEQGRGKGAAPSAPATLPAETWLESRRQLGGAGQSRLTTPMRRKPVVRPTRPLDDDDAEKTSEDATAASLEVTDYDAELEQLVAKRAKDADRGGRAEGSAEGMSVAQAARRGGREPVPIGTVKEHAAWHQQIGAPAAAAAGARGRGPLGRWADGSLRGALILSEVLGRPVGER
jgi:hypothetical protein